jgi:transcriptional regulator with XRE-family HTH domain
VQSAEDFLRTLAPIERGRVLSVLRSAGGMTRDELAKEAKVSPNTISDWEKGKIKQPRALFAKLDPVLDFTILKIQHALILIRAPQTAGDVAEAAAGHYDPHAADESGSPDVRGMSSPEIEGELRQLSSQFGHVLFRALLLATERAFRSAQRPTS